MKDLNELFFNAEKIIEKTVSPVRYRVKGYPHNPRECVDYNEFKHDFRFVTYKEVVAGGLLRAILLFNLPLNELREQKVKHGRNKQWFTAEIVSHKNNIELDGELHYPFLSISYSYDAVHAIKYEIGIYRSKCTNGLILGYKSLLKVTINPEDLFELDLWYNHCLILNLMREYERGIRILKRTEMSFDVISRIVQNEIKLSKNDAGFIEVTDTLNPIKHDNVVASLIELYAKELGLNGFTALNVVTDLASNYTRMNSKKKDTIDNSALGRQRQAGVWLDQLIRFIEKYNGITLSSDFQNNPLFGSKPDKPNYSFNLDMFNDFLKKEKK